MGFWQSEYPSYYMDRYRFLSFSLKTLGYGGQFGSLIYAVNEVTNGDSDPKRLLGAGAVFVACKFLEKTEVVKKLRRYNAR